VHPGRNEIILQIREDDAVGYVAARGREGAPMNGTVPRECLREARVSNAISLDFMLVFAKIHLIGSARIDDYQGRSR